MAIIRYNKIIKQFEVTEGNTLQLRLLTLLHGGGTTIQAGMSRVRFPMVSLKFFIDIIIPAVSEP
jgi:hypothetical protein